jgi:hypothetical protein
MIDLHGTIPLTRTRLFEYVRPRDEYSTSSGMECQPINFSVGFSWSMGRDAVMDTFLGGAVLITPGKTG